MIEVNINRVDNGYVVRAGCLTLAFSNKTELAVELTRWLENPDVVEKEYIAKYRRGMIGGDVEEPAAVADTIRGLSRSAFGAGDAAREMTPEERARVANEAASRGHIRPPRT